MALIDLIYGAKSQTSIGVMTLDVLLSEKITYPSNITEYPVEKGSPTNDSIIVQSLKLSIAGTIEGGSTSIFSALIDGSPTGKVKLQDAKAAIEALWTNHTPVSIVTGLAVYPNMGMLSGEVSRAGSGSGAFISITCEFIQITTVSNSTTTVAADTASPSVAKKLGATKSASGQVTGVDPSAQAATASTSIAKSLASKISGLFQ